jgi:hypothetical protein
MAKRKTKKYWEERARKAERSARTSREKAKAYQEGIQEGIKIAKEAKS